MKFTIKAAPIEKQKKTCIITGIYEDGKLTPTAKEIDRLSGGMVKKLIDQGAFRGKVGDNLPLYTCSNLEHVLLMGCGKQEPLTASVFRKIIMSTVQALNQTQVSEAVCYLTDLDIADRSLPWKIKYLVESATEANYRFDTFKSEKEPASTLKTLILPEHQQEAKACEQALKEGAAIAEGVIFTKNLANTPSNVCTPAFLAHQATELSKSCSSLSVKVLEEKEMRQLGMGALLAVSQGSIENAKLICLEYTGASKKQRPVALVGKGVTFDTGGNSLKPPNSMVGMKYDMCGAATVLGTIKAAVLLKLPLNLVGIIPAVENMPGGSAYKPEDILTSLSGQTIEVISTDAEGRLALSDALTYCERYNPDVMIDIATLTGAVVIALGTHATGLMTNHEPLAKDLLKAGQESNDRAWQLPLWDEYQEQIKSPFADMANTGGRAAGSITAACFLSRFVKKFHWAHLDVAGTAAVMEGTSERMASGRPVPLLAQYLIDRAKQNQ